MQIAYSLGVAHHSHAEGGRLLQSSQMPYNAINELLNKGFVVGLKGGATHSAFSLVTQQCQRYLLKAPYSVQDELAIRIGFQRQKAVMEVQRGGKPPRNRVLAISEAEGKLRMRAWRPHLSAE
jgi:hypothetical protein